MKRIFTGRLVATLAVAISFSMAATASAGDPATAHTSAKSKKASAKDKRRANAKAKAKARQRAKARANKCKPQKRGKATKRGKAKAKQSAVKKKKNCKKAKKEPAKSKGGSGLADGLYSDAAKNVKVQISGKGSTVAVTFSLPNPIPREYTFTAPAKSTGSKLSASQTESTLGGSGSLSWSLTVNTRTLSYKLDFKENVQFPEQNPTMTEDSVSGTLKAG